ncbi:MAG: hypothetical protein ACREO8_07495 [Luteimonas sp.]
MKTSASIRWGRIGATLLLLALIVSACSYLLDAATGAFPQHSDAVNVVVVVVFSLLLAFVVLPLLAKELGFQITGGARSSKEDHDSSSET